jgi:hypothetical protein
MCLCLAVEPCSPETCSGLLWQYFAKHSYANSTGLLNSVSLHLPVLLLAAVLLYPRPSHKTTRWYRLTLLTFRPDSSLQL